MLSNSIFLTFLKLTLKFDPLDISDILSMNLYRVCICYCIYPKLCNKQIIKCFNY